MDDDYEDPAPFIPPSPPRRSEPVPEPAPTMMSRLGDAALNLTAPLRYGVSPAEKIRMMVQGEIPGIPMKHGTGLHGEPQSYVDPQDPETERYASNYIGAQRFGALPASLFNAIALGDIGDFAMGVPGIAKRKAVGIEGALRADPNSMWAPILRRIQAGLQ